MNDDINRARRYPSESGSGPGNDFHPAVELLSEYLDDPNDLTAAEQEAIDGHLASCAECQTVLTDLRLMVRTLGTLPEREAPRSFALTRDMLEPATTPAHPAPVVLQESAQWHARYASKVRWATAVAAALFVFVISADLVTNGLRVTGSDDDAAGNVVAVRQADDDQADAYSAEEPLSDPAPADAEDAPYAAEAPASEQEEAADEAVPESADVPEEESEPVPESDEAPAGGASDETLTAEDGDAVKDDEDTSALSMQREEISDEPQSEMMVQEDSSQMRWRIAEVSLALVLALLLAVMIGLPKQRGSRRG